MDRESLIGYVVWGPFNLDGAARELEFSERIFVSSDLGAIYTCTTCAWAFTEYVSVGRFCIYNSMLHSPVEKRVCLV